MENSQIPKKPFELFSPEEMAAILPVVLADLKHHSDPDRRQPSNTNIRRDFFRHVIRELFSERRFKHVEPVDDGREGLFVKGFVRNVWEYLDTAYDLVHSTDFENEEVGGDEGEFEVVEYGASIETLARKLAAGVL